MNPIKDEIAFAKTVQAFKEAGTIIFNSDISNEEAMMLQSLKQKFNYKLLNKEAKKFQNFLNDFSSVSAKHLYGGNEQALESFDFALCLGLSVSADSPKVLDALSKAKNERDAYINYMHPLEDESLQNMLSQHTKYEVGSEEGIVAMLADVIVNEEAKKKYDAFFSDLDEGYICGESSIGEEEFEDISEELEKSKKPVLIVGPDLYNHPRSNNIAKVLGMISKYSNFEVFMVGSELNSLGVALICDLDEAAEGKTLGFRVKADYTLSCSENGDFLMPSMKQEEGSVTLADKKVVVLETTSSYEGYRLDDIAKALGLNESVNDYTAKLPARSGYKVVTLDALKSNAYELETLDVKSENDALELIDDISEFNGTVVYRCNHSQFNPDSNTSEKNEDLVLLGSKQFATAAKMKTGTMVRFEMDGKTYLREFKVSDDLKGTIACNPVFDSTDNYDEYRYKRVNLEEVNE